MLKGLLIKDFYTLSKQLKLLLLMVIVFACIPGSFLAPFALIIAIMLPITSLAYDEQSKWPTLAAMMPYSEKIIVLSKYLLGFLAIGGAAVIIALTQIIWGFLRPGDITLAASLATFLPIILVAILVQSISLPIMFRFGVEKGRFTFFIMMGIISLSGLLFSQLNIDASFVFAQIMGNLPLIAILVLILIAIITLLSIILSIKIYKNSAH